MQAMRTAHAGLNSLQLTNGLINSYRANGMCLPTTTSQRRIVLKAKSVKPQPVPNVRVLTCIMCSAKTALPYGALRNGMCTCSKACYDKANEKKERY